MNNVLPTMFAPAERASDEEIKKLSSQFMDVPLLAKLLDAVPGGMLILNINRQIVFANRSALKIAGLDNLLSTLGLRPGEAMQCIHSADEKWGCGTSEFCRTCGAVKAILASQEGRSDVQECRVLRKPEGEALDLRVWTTPLLINSMALTIFALMDISDEKRRKALERIFFHDILNTASGIKGFAELLKDADSGEVKQYQETIFSLARMIVDEINSQRTLTAAENNELKLNPSKVRALELLNEIVNLYKNHDVAAGRQVRIDQTEIIDILGTVFILQHDARLEHAPYPRRLGQIAVHLRTKNHIFLP